jgi:hypothetical protein
MKTRKCLYPSVLVFGLTAGAVPTYAFNNQELSGLCLAESIVSIFGALAEHQGCPKEAVLYDVSITANAAGDGGAKVTSSSGDIRTLENRLSGVGERGAFCDVRTPDNGVINGVSVTDYTGTLPGLPSGRRTHAWSQGHTIMISGAKLRLDGLNFGEHNIKNFNLTEDPLIFTDEGLEVITRDRYPSSTWKQSSYYHRPDGDIGRLYFTKGPRLSESVIGSCCRRWHWYGFTRPSRSLSR